MVEGALLDKELGRQMRGKENVRLWIVSKRDCSLLALHARDLQTRPFAIYTAALCPARTPESPTCLDCRIEWILVYHEFPMAKCNYCGQTPTTWRLSELTDDSLDDYGRRLIYHPDCCERVNEEHYLEEEAA